MTPTTLFIRLLGGFQLADGDAPLTRVNTARLQSLLAYLVLHVGSAQLRQHIAFRLWPDTLESHARNNLRQALHQLRQALPDHERFLSADANTVTWHTNSDQFIDVIRFEQALAMAEAAERHDDQAGLQRALEEAVSLYQGDLLPACYDEWIAPKREWLRQQCRHACHKLALLLESRNEVARALQTAEQLLRLDPLDEEAYILLLRLYGQTNNLGGARRAYQDAVDRLKQELDAEPSDALRRAYERVQRAPLAVHPSSSATALAAPALIGRRSEWQQLLTTWRRAAQGETHLVLVTGEAGVGKSRLAEELFHWVKQQGFAAAYTRSYAAEGRLALAPITDWLRSEALQPALNALDDLWLTEVARLLPELLTERRTLSRPGPIGEYGQRQRFFEALARAVAAAPRQLLLWIDDLQWCDSETMEWLHFLLRFAPRSRLLLLGTVRSEESPPDGPLATLVRQLHAEDKLTTVELAPLDAAETSKLASQIEGHELGIAASIRLFHETEGNPLFVVEAVRAGIGKVSAANINALAEASAPSSSTLPPRVFAVIAGRLAQLSADARSVAELGAALGRALTLSLLLQASSLKEESAIRALDELWQKRIIREQSTGVFDFTHDKLREVAYAQLSPPQRRLLHRRIAQALEAVHADDLSPVSAQIAAQYEQAGLIREAMPFYLRAGLVAGRVYANSDAIALLTRALSLLSQLPPGSRRDTQELELRLALSPLYRITQGWTSPEVVHGLNRALILSDQVGDSAQRAQTLYGLQSLYVVEARLEKVEYTYAEMHKLFMQTQGGQPPPFAGLMHAGARFHMGDLRAAGEEFAQAIAVRDSRHIRDLQESQGVNYLVHGHAWYAHLLWCQGYPQRALTAATDAIRFAREFVQPFNQGLAITYMAMLQEMCAPMETFRAYAEEAAMLTKEYQSPYYNAWARVLASFACAWQEPDSANVLHLREAIRAFADTGVHLRMPYYLSLLARACWRAGQADAALEVIADALTESLQNTERWWDTELHRLRGEWLLAQGADPDDVETAFQRALEVARAQGARSLELRAATSLARFRQSLGSAAEARAVLAPVFAGFSEGFDTPDLLSAQALLASL